MEWDLNKFSQQIIELDKNDTSYVVVTLTDVIGSAPQNLGARMIVDEAGKILFGTVGGGKVEARCINESVKMIQDSIETLAFTWNLQKDIKMTCGGVVRFLFEKRGTHNAWNIALFGAGHVSQALVRILVGLKCHLTVIDDRSAWLDRLPQDKNIKILHRKEMKNVVDELQPNTFLISMTKGHSFDTPILERALKKELFPFVGVIGSEPKRNAITSELRALGVLDSQLTNLVCPIGEKIGNNSPEEISISIAAQLLRLRDSK